MNARRFVWVTALHAATVLVLVSAPPISAAEDEIVIHPDGVEPAAFHAVTGQRVNFVKRVNNGAVHVEFAFHPREHEVYQIPATGPVWAIFHRPGTHPYVVHIYRETGTTVLRGFVEVAEDPQRPREFGTCAAVVMGDCVEP